MTIRLTINAKFIMLMVPNRTACCPTSNKKILIQTENS